MPSGRLAVISCIARLTLRPRVECRRLRASRSQPDRSLPVDPEHRLRRIGIGAPDFGDVTQPYQPPVGDEIDRENIIHRLERAGNAKQELFVRGLEFAGRPHDVLRLKCSGQSLLVHSEPGQLMHREFNVHFLVLSAENFDLRDIGHLQQLRAAVLDVVAQLTLAEAVCGKAIDDAERIAEFIVETRPDYPLWQGVPHVGDAFAHVVPDVGDFASRGRSLQIDKIVVRPGLVELRRKSRLGVSFSVRSSRSVTCCRVSFRVWRRARPPARPSF